MSPGGACPTERSQGGIDEGILFLFCDQPMIFHGQIWGPGGAYLLTAWGRIGGGPKIFSQGKVQKKKNRVWGILRDIPSKTLFLSISREPFLQKQCF